MMQHTTTEEELNRSKNFFDLLKIMQNNSVLPAPNEPQKRPVTCPFKDFKPITVTFGGGAEDTIVKTVGGEQLQGVTDVVVKMNADDGIPYAVITIINPKIETK